jgi:predicted nucleic acid-binding protein
VSTLALDTSVAVPLLVRSHAAHAAVRAAIRGRSPVLTAPSQAETYAVLTRLPGDARIAPADAARLLEANFGPAVLLDPATVAGLPRVLATLGLAGGAVYDAMVALAAKQQAVALGSRDARALGTYAAVGVEVEVIAG